MTPSRRPLPVVAWLIATTALACQPYKPVPAPGAGITKAKSTPAALQRHPKCAEGFVHLPSGSFCIGRTEVTVQSFKRCVDEGACSTPRTKAPGCNWPVSGREQHPINCVPWADAEAYCRWAGGWVPSEKQWLVAARGAGAREYPWGTAEPTCERAVLDKGCGRGSTWPVCSKPAGNTPEGACDMLGNVWEWLSDEGNLDGDPTRAVRGGGWKDDASSLTRGDVWPLTQPNDRFGIRCASAELRPVRSPGETLTQRPTAACPNATPQLLRVQRWLCDVLAPERGGAGPACVTVAGSWTCAYGPRDWETTSREYGEAVHALRSLGPHHVALLPSLVPGLEHGARMASVLRVPLVRMGDAAVPALVKAATQGPEPARAGAQEVLARLRPTPRVQRGLCQVSFPGRDQARIAAKIQPAVLLELIDDPQDVVAAGAIHFLPVASKKDKTLSAAALPRLIRGLRRPGVQVAAAAALATIGPPAAPAVPELIRQLELRPRRSSLAHALGSIGPAAAAAVPLLIKLLKGDPDLMIIYAVGDMGAAANAALPVLKRLMRPERLSCAEGGGCLTAAVAIQSSHRIRLAPLQKDPERTLQYLTGVLSSPYPEVLRWAMEELKDLRAAKAKAVPQLVRILGHRSPKACCLDGPADLEIRAQAAELLGNLGPAALPAAPRLAAALRGRKDEPIEQTNLRVAAAEALGQIGPAARGVLAALRRAHAPAAREPEAIAFAVAVDEAICLIEGRSPDACQQRRTCMEKSDSDAEAHARCP